MHKFTYTIAAGVATLFAVVSAQAQTMSSADYKAKKDQISADYDAANANCSRMTGNEKDVCVEQAKGKQKVAKAELEYGRSGKSEDSNKVAIARAEADYDVAKERCDSKNGNDKDICQKEAKAAEAKAKAAVKPPM